MSKTLFLFILLLSLSATQSFSQTGSITGVVTDSLTGQPVVNLTVFIPSTTFGTTTNQKGEYLLEMLNQGDYILMFRHLSYPSTSRFITIEPGKKIILNLVIAEKSQKIREVVVVGKLPDRRMATFLFNKYFLGDENGTYCKLENPAALSFYSDGNTLKATAKEPLKITNRHLGYNITFYLDYFQCIDNRNSEFNNNDNSNFGYSGYALFEDLTSAMPIKAMGWKFKRNGEFKGSLRHFLACLYRNELTVNHYYLRRAYRGFNEIQQIEKQSNAMTKIKLAQMDSLSSWNHVSGKSDILY
ncbi:MAG: carboxypeptidase-like regulatory domain-containing protein, partial [Bacteroidia bacterium]|nr:carboxypeptidase-like regulatory domain-containing protein [Bacteroidia bacterium]